MIIVGIVNLKRQTTQIYICLHVYIYKHVKYIKHTGLNSCFFQTENIDQLASFMLADQLDLSQLIFKTFK